MATPQEDLLKALRGNSGREQVNFDLGQVQLRPTIQRGGQYNVQVQQTPQTNPALQLADALKGGSQILSNFVDIQAKQGEIEASVLSPAEVQRQVESGDPNAMSFLDKLGKEKTFTENVYKRYFNSTVQPELTALAQELKSKPVHEYANQGITTPEDFKVYADQRVKELTDKFGEYTDKSPYAKVLHNQLVEEIVPKLVQQQVAGFDENVTVFNKESALANLGRLEQNGVVTNPEPTNQNKTQNVFRDKPRGTIFGTRNKQDPTYDSNSALGIGFNASKAEQDEIKAGKTNDAKMIENKDFALSSDLAEQARAAGFKARDTMTFTTADGRTHTGRWMDVTAEKYLGKTLTGRVDIYSPNADSEFKDVEFTGFSRNEGDAVKSFQSSIESMTQVNVDSLITAGFSPAEANKYVRENIVKEIKTFSTEGRFTEARKLQGALSNIKVAGQLLFGSTDGRLQAASIEDLIDRDEEQESSANIRTSQVKIENATAPLSRNLMLATDDDREELYKKATAEIANNLALTPAEQVRALKEIDQVYQSKEAAAYTASTRDNTVITEANNNGGLTSAFNNFIKSGNDALGAKAIIETLPEDLQNKVLVPSELGGPPAISPTFVKQLQATLVTVGANKSAEAYDKVKQILRGESFMYEVDGTKTEFKGTTDKLEQRNLLLQLGRVYQQDLNASLTSQLEANMKSNPAFTKPVPVAVNPYQQKVNDAAKQLTDTGIPAEQAKSMAIKEVAKAAKAGSLLENGKIRTTPGFFESLKDYLEAYTNDSQSGLYTTDEQSESAHKSAKTIVGKLAKQRISSFNSNPVANIKQIQDLQQSFKNVGIPWEAIKSGVIDYEEVKVTSSPSFYIGGGEPAITKVPKVYPIRQYLEAPESESTYQILPLSLMRSKETPRGKAAIQEIADKYYNGNVDLLVTGQEAWYSSRNIKISK